MLPLFMFTEILQTSWEVQYMQMLGLLGPRHVQPQPRPVSKKQVKYMLCFRSMNDPIDFRLATARPKCMSCLHRKMIQKELTAQERWGWDSCRSAGKGQQKGHPMQCVLPDALCAPTLCRCCNLWAASFCQSSLPGCSNNLSLSVCKYHVCAE